MNINERRKQILDLIKTKQKIDIEELTPMFNVSLMTIRRDLNQLEKEGLLIRTHGGAAAPYGLKEETPYLQKESANKKEKRAIALRAAELVHDHSAIILDSGTTTFELAKVLKEKEGLTVVTNDILIAAELLHSSVEVIVTGGELQRGVGAMFGAHTQLLLKELNVAQFFLGAHAIDPEAGVTAPTMEKATIKRLMIEASKETWLIADSSKFGQRSFAHVCNLDQVSGIITDTGVSPLSTNGSYHKNLVITDTSQEDAYEDRDYS